MITVVDITNSVEILAITDCWVLFPKDETKAKEAYRKLSRVWHPDINNQSQESTRVFQQINSLYTAATDYFRAISGRKESTSHSEYIKLHDNKKLLINYLYKADFELGTVYTGKKAIVIQFEAGHEKLAANAANVMGHFEYINNDVKTEMLRYLPWFNQQKDWEHGKLILLDKSTGMIPLPAVINHYGGEIPDRHVTWMVSKLLNICCYLDICNLSHNGITISNCYIDPVYHKVGLYGGWQYTVPQGSPMLGTCKAVYDAMPIDVKNSKLGSIKTDLESIRKLASTLYCGKAPKAIQDWLDSPSEDSALDAYESWFEHINEAYGKREFIVMDITPEQVYSKYY